MHLLFPIPIFIGNTYRQLIRTLNLSGFHRHQYSDYRRDNFGPIRTWLLMYILSQIRPPGKLQSTVLSLKMHHIPYLDDMDITNRLQFGGAHSTRLLGPTPAGLIAQIPDGLLNPAPLVPGPGYIRPVHTRSSPNANNPMNYRE